MSLEAKSEQQARNRREQPEPEQAIPSSVDSSLARFGLVPADLVGVLETEAEAAPADDPERALERRIARVDVEEPFATAYLTFDDGYYLCYAARIDEDGVILLDRFCEPAPSYEEYWVFDELEGESGPPPAEAAPAIGTPFHPLAWQEAAGRTVIALGWYEEGMQAFVHFEEGGYLTLAARAAGGVAYLAGYLSAEDPPDEDGFVLFEEPAE